MNYKRKKATTRREGKRADNKSYRMAEKQAMHGGSLRNPRTCNWHAPMPPLPVGERDSMGKRLGGKKERPKKKKLPTCHHEWYEEHIKEDCKSFFCLNPDCSDYWHRNDPSRYNHPWDRHNFCMNGYEGEKYLWRGVLEYVVEWEQRTCINCWEVRKTNLTNPLDRRRTWRKRYIRSWKPRTAYRKP